MSLLEPTWTYGDLAKWMPLVKKRGVIRPGQWLERIEEQPPDRPAPASTLLNVFEDGVVDAIRTAPLPWLREHALASRAKALDFPLRLVAKGGVAALTATPRIVVGTIHSVKGSEADTVYLFPDLSPQGAAQHQRRDDSVRRMMYVGMTRARQTLVICGASTPDAVAL